MRSSSLSILSTLSVVAISGATGDFGDPNLPLYSYSKVNSLEFEFSDSDSPPVESDESSDSASIVSSSLLYEGGCIVSSQAISCQGGDSFSAYLDLFSDGEDEEDETDDDNDDNDDDGHSSMLSGAALRRSKAYASGAMRHGNTDRAPSTRPRPAPLSEGPIPLQNVATSAAFKVRGGAVSTVAGNELAKKLIVAAVVTLFFEATVGHVLEFLKIVMQTSPSGTTYSDVFQNITNDKGISGLWDGFMPWGVIQSVLKGGVFGLAHASASKLLLPLSDAGTLPKQVALTLAGGMGGLFQGYVLSPTLLMKTRVMTNPVFRESMSLIRTTWLSVFLASDVVKKEGVVSLMKGSNAFATKRVLDWSTRFFFSDMFEAMFTTAKGSALTTMERTTSSFLGGVASTMITLPLDVLVAKTQDSKKAGDSLSAVQLFNDELTDLGWNGLRQKYQQGFEARLLHVCLTTVVLRTGAPVVYGFLFPTQA